MKIADILIVEDSSKKVNENKIKEVLDKINVEKIDKININRIHIPGLSDDDILGVYVIVRDVAET
ncbi:MAG: hypothetical protein RRE78_04495 [Acidianus sp.]|jgi:ribosomal protein L12E/L44/L45/RPP1/RPP2|nr:hypothetical protein [Acidianus sp.]